MMLSSAKLWTSLNKSSHMWVVVLKKASVGWWSWQGLDSGTTNWKKSGPQLKEKNQKKSIAQKQVSSLRGILYSFASLSHNLKGFILFDLKVSRSVYSFLHYRSVSHNLLLSYWHSFACLLLFLRFAQS